jgi:hypothetical protein
MGQFTSRMLLAQYTYWSEINSEQNSRGTRNKITKFLCLFVTTAHNISDYVGVLQVADSILSNLHKILKRTGY